MAEQYPQTEDEKYRPHENSPMDAERFRTLARPSQPKGRQQGGSRGLFGIFSHWAKVTEHLQPLGKGGEE